MNVDALDILKLGGGLAGLVALAWRVVDEFGSHLRISVKVDGPKDGWITVLTSVENKGNRRKDIAYALLVIGPISESPVETAQILARILEYKGRLNFTNDLSEFVLDKSEIHQSRAMIPLSFYYQENISIADETLTYRVPVPIKDWETQAPYAVRFFLFPRNRLHRSTQDSFVSLAVSTRDT
jgi:hypothetical protein